MNFIKNFSAGSIRFIISAAAGFISIAVLIRQLDDYDVGTVILATNLNHYFALLVMLFTTTTARFASISYFSKRYLVASQQISSALAAITFIGCAIIFSLFIFFKLSKSFGDTRLEDIRPLFYFTAAAMITMSLTAVLSAAYFITNKFYLSDIAETCGKFLFLITILFLASSDSLTPITYGAAVFIGAVLALVICVYSFWKLRLKLAISISNIRLAPLFELLHSGKYVLINTIGVMLYTITDLIIIQHYFGKSTLVRYGPAVQYATILPLVCVLVNKIFEPKIAQLIASQNNTEISKVIEIIIHTLTSINLVAGVFLLLISHLVFPIWLSSIAFLDILLLSILIANSYLHLSTAPVFSYLLMTDNLKWPAFVTLLIGILNLIFSIILVKYTALGMYGAAVASFFAIAGKTVFYNLYYTNTIIRLHTYKIWTLILTKLFIGSLTVCTYYYVTHNTPFPEYNWLLSVILFTLVLTYAILIIPQETRKKINGFIFKNA